MAIAARKPEFHFVTNSGSALPSVSRSKNAGGSIVLATETTQNWDQIAIDRFSLCRGGIASKYAINCLCSVSLNPTNLRFAGPYETKARTMFLEKSTLGSATRGANLAQTLRHSFGEVAAAEGGFGRYFLRVVLNQGPLARSVTAPVSVSRKLSFIGGRDESEGAQPMQTRSPRPKRPC